MMGYAQRLLFTNASVVELSVVGRIVDKRRYWNQTRKDRKMKSLEQQNQELLNEVKLMMAKETFLEKARIYANTAFTDDASEQMILSRENMSEYMSEYIDEI